MPCTTHIETVRQLIDRFFNQHDPDATKDYFTDDFAFHGTSAADFRGLDIYRRTMGAFFAGFPDAHATEQDLIESGNRICARFVVEATHKGVLWGLPATGHAVRWDAIMIYRFEGDRVAEQWANEDWSAILHAVGFVTPPFAR